VEAQPGPIGAGQLDLHRSGGLGPGGDGGHLDKAQGPRGHRRGRGVTALDLFVQVGHAEPHLVGYAGERQGRGQRDGLLP